MKQEGWVYFDRDAGCYVYRTFCIGSCIRSLTAARLGESAFPVHANLRKAMDVSAALEDEILEKLQKEFIWRQKTVELGVGISFDTEDTTESRKVIVRGHIDALEQDSDCIVDVKVLSEANYSAYEDGGLKALGKLGTKYLWQGAVYGHATGRKFRFGLGLKVKNDKGEWNIVRVRLTDPMDPEEMVPLATIQDRIRTIESYAERDELPDCTDGCREGDSYSECHIFFAPAQGDDETHEKLVRYLELKELLGSDDKDPNKRKGLLGEYEDIKDWMKETYGNWRTTEKVTSGPITASVIPNKGREGLDTKRLRKELPSIYEQYIRFGDPFYTLIVKVSAGRGEEAQ